MNAGERRSALVKKPRHPVLGKLGILVLSVAAILLLVHNWRTAQLVDEDVARFHQRFEAAQYGAIYDAASPTYQNAYTRDRLAAKLARIHERVGACHGARTTGRRSYSGRWATAGSVKYISTCEKGELRESFGYAWVGSEVRLERYDATPVVRQAPAQQ